MLGVITNNIVEVLGMSALAIIAVFIGSQKLLKEWKSTNAETNIITLMHTELERMSSQNASLSIELGRLHSEVINLNKQLQNLSVENQRLQVEVCALTTEVSKFKELSRTGKAYKYATN